MLINTNHVEITLLQCTSLLQEFVITTIMMVFWGSGVHSALLGVFFFYTHSPSTCVSFQRLEMYKRNHSPHMRALHVYHSFMLGMKCSFMIALLCIHDYQYNLNKLLKVLGTNCSSRAVLAIHICSLMH